MLEVLQLLEPVIGLADLIVTASKSSRKPDPKNITSKPVDILREKLAGGTPSQIQDALKLVADEGTNIADLFTQDTSMLGVLGSRLARTENSTELKESLSALGKDLKQILKIKNTAGSTLVSETAFYALKYEAKPSQLRAVLTELKKLGADMQGADIKLQGDSYTTIAIKSILDKIDQGTDWIRRKV